MNTGKLIHLFTLQMPTGRSNDYGEKVEEYVDAFPFYGSLKAKSDSERLKAAMVQRNTTHEVNCHFDPMIASNCRLKLNERSFDIVSIIPDEFETEMLLQVNEVVCNG